MTDLGRHAYNGVMIPRYSRPEMAALWSEEAKLNHWLEIEVLACEGMARYGHIPADDAQIIRAKAKFDIAKVQENEKRTNHDVIAFLRKSRFTPDRRDGLSTAALLRPTCSIPRWHCNLSPAPTCCSLT